MNAIEWMVRDMHGHAPIPTTRDGLRNRVLELRKTKSQREVAKDLGISRSLVFNLQHEALAQQQGAKHV